MTKRIPVLKTEKEVHDFWSSHSLTDFPKDIEATDEKIQLDPALAYKIKERTKKKMIALRLEHWQIQRAKAIAAKKRVPYQQLLRFWITQGLRHEALGPRS